MPTPKSEVSGTLIEGWVCWRRLWKGRDEVPTVLRIGRYRFHFYSDERGESAHVHVATADGECKFWLEPIILAGNKGLRPEDVRHIERLVYENVELLKEKYYEYHRV